MPDHVHDFQPNYCIHCGLKNPAFTENDNPADNPNIPIERIMGYKPDAEGGSPAGVPFLCNAVTPGEPMSHTHVCIREIYHTNPHSCKCGLNWDYYTHDVLKHVLPSNTLGGRPLESEHITEERIYHEYQVELRLIIESLHRTLANMYSHHTNDSWMQAEINTARLTVQRLQSKLGV